MQHCKFESYHSELMNNNDLLNILKLGYTRNQRNITIPLKRVTYFLLVNLQFEGFIEQFSVCKNSKFIRIMLNQKKVKHTNAISLLEANYVKSNKILCKTMSNKAPYLDCYLVQKSSAGGYLTKVAHLR